MKEPEKQKLLVIVGPTASGKTSLSIQLARKYRGEVVSADSRQVYKGLNIGTGKVTEEEMQGVPHHLLDVADPKEVYTVADYIRDASLAIEGIHARDNLPIVAGGSFLYVDALLGKVTPPDVPPDLALRAELEDLSTEELTVRLASLDRERMEGIDAHNRRRLIRAIEIATALGKVPRTIPLPRYHSFTLGIDIPKEVLHANIKARLYARLEGGMVEEVRALHAEGLSYERMEDLGLEYRYIARYLQGTLSYEEMATEIETKSRQYAKRQMTWLKRDPDIHWVRPEDLDHIGTLLGGFLKES